MLTTVSAVVFIALVIAVVAGLFEHPYAGLVVFVVVPGFFVLGLLLIPLGMWLEARRLQHHPEATRDWPVFDLRKPTTRRTVLAVIALTAVNIVIVLLAAQGRDALHGFAGILRAGVSSADAPAVHRLAGRAALGSHVHPVSCW